jgi:hypothetical protein
LVPTSGNVGTQVTFSIGSSAFPVDGDYKIRWSPSANFEDDKTVVLKEGTSPKNSMSIIDTVAVPEAKMGINYIQLIRMNRDDPVNFQFTVRPKVDIAPTSTIPGGMVTISGTGLPAEDTGTLSFDGKVTNVAITTNKVGSFTAQFTIPDTIAGTHKFIVQTPKALTDTPTLTMQVTPTITMKPLQPEVGSNVTLTGRGFAARSGVQVKYDNTSIANSPTTDDNGNLNYEFKVPESQRKEHEIVVTDAAGNTAKIVPTLETKALPKPIPVSPKDQRIGLFGSEMVTFTWTKVSDAPGLTYIIEVGNNLNFFPLKPGMKKTGLTQTSCTLNLEPGSYFWRVKVVDASNNEGEWAISPYHFEVGFLPVWTFAVIGAALLFVFIWLIRAFFRRLGEYYN